MDPRIILGGQAPDPVGAIARGGMAAGQQNELARLARQTEIFRQHGPGLVSGQPDAVNALAALSPEAAQGFQAGAIRNDIGRQSLSDMRMAAKERAKGALAQMDAAQAAQEAEMIERGLRGASAFYERGDREGFSRFVAAQGLDPAQFTFEDFPAHAAQFGGVLDAWGEIRGMIGQPEPSAPPAAFQALQLRAQEAGFQPGTPEYQAFMAAGGRDGSLVTVNTGDQQPRYLFGAQAGLPQGWRLNTETGQAEPIPGGPVERDAASDADRATARQAQIARAGGTVVQDLQRALDLLPDLSAPATMDGPVGGVARTIGARVPGSVLNRITQFTESALSNVGLDTLQSMRENSPTGGALGQVPIQQQRRLEQVLGSLAVDQPVEVLEANIKRVINIYTDIIYGTAAERAALVERGELSAEDNAMIDGFYYELPFDERGRRVSRDPQPVGQRPVTAPASGMGGPARPPRADDPAFRGGSGSALEQGQSIDDLLRLYGGD